MASSGLAGHHNLTFIIKVTAHLRKKLLLTISPITL
jgi:hypothetical protein